MACGKIFFLLAFLTTLLGLATAGGKRDYNEECSVLSQIGNVFKSDENDDPDACNTDKGLFCTGKTCSCQPGHVYEKSGILSVFSGGKCVVAANFPCTKDSTCISNAECERICKCKEGYRAVDGSCTSSSGRVSLSVFYLVGLVASYFIFTH